MISGRVSVLNAGTRPGTTRDPKIQPHYISNPIPKPDELTKDEQFSILGKIANFSLVQGSNKIPIAAKIAIYRGYN